MTTSRPNCSTYAGHYLLGLELSTNAIYIKALQRLHELMPGSLGVQSNDGWTPAHAASNNGHVEVLQCVHESYHGQ